MRRWCFVLPVGVIAGGESFGPKFCPSWNIGHLEHRTSQRCLKNLGPKLTATKFGPSGLIVDSTPPRDFFKDRGRDGRCRPPPAQIRTRASNSYGSCLESGVESNTGERVDRLRQREVACNDPHKATPRHLVTLAPPTKLGKPKLLHFVKELFHPF